MLLCRKHNLSYGCRGHGVRSSPVPTASDRVLWEHRRTPPPPAASRCPTGTISAVSGNVVGLACREGRAWGLLCWPSLRRSGNQRGMKPPLSLRLGDCRNPSRKGLGSQALARAHVLSDVPRPPLVSDGFQAFSSVQGHYPVTPRRSEGTHLKMATGPLTYLGTHNSNRILSSFFQGTPPPAPIKGSGSMTRLKCGAWTRGPEAS